MENERRVARRISMNNARTLYGVSSSRGAVKSAADRRETAKELSGLVVTGIGTAMDKVTKTPGARIGVRAAIKGANFVPGLVMDYAEYRTAKDKDRALAGIVGGMVGSIGGGALGGVAGPVGAVGGSMAGSYAGRELGERLYDNRAAIKDRVMRDFADVATHGLGPGSTDALARPLILGLSHR